jgi:hypothetical protein
VQNACVQLGCGGVACNSAVLLAVPVSITGETAAAASTWMVESQGEKAGYHGCPQPLVVLRASLLLRRWVAPLLDSLVAVGDPSCCPEPATTCDGCHQHAPLACMPVACRSQTSWTGSAEVGPWMAFQRPSAPLAQPQPGQQHPQLQAEVASRQQQLGAGQLQERLLMQQPQHPRQRRPGRTLQSAQA